jgi:hypothetical protein
MTLPPSHAESAPQQVVQICVRLNFASTRGQPRVPYDVTLTREPGNAPLMDYIGDWPQTLNAKFG